MNAVPPRRLATAPVRALLVAIPLFALAAAGAAADAKGAPGAAPNAPSAAECALLDDPSSAGRLDGLLMYLAKGCGREAEFIGGVLSGEGYPGEPSESPLSGGVPVSNPAQDTSGTAKTQSETSIAFNPTTGVLCATWNDSFHGVTQNAGFSGFGRSIDGGNTWTDFGAVAPTSNFDSGDPSLVWRKSDGKFYYAALKSGGLGLYRSDDDCQSFTFLSQISTGSDDKELMTVDNNDGSPYYGRLYVVWTDFGQSGRIFETHTDNGTTWSTQVALSGATDDVQGAWPVVAPNNDVYAAWVRWNPFPSGPIDVQVARSTDGGATWGLVANPMTGQVNPRDSAATSSCGRPALGGNIRYLPSPTIAVDGSGNLHVVYSYDPDAFNSGDESNVYYRRSTTQGASWDPEILINDDGTTTDQWQPSLSVGAGNVVTVGYYSRQNDTGGNLMFDYYSRTSFDGGASFQPSVRMTATSSSVVLDPNLATCYHGDYDTQTHGTGFAHYLWSDDHVATPDIYTYKTPAGTDFLPVSAPASQRVCSPTSAQYTIDVLQFQGFTENVTLSASGAPVNATTGFSVNPVTPPGSSVLTVTTSGVASGTSSITVTGTSSPSAIVHATQVGLTVDAAVPPAPTLATPADGATELPLKPSFSWGPLASAIDYHLEIATDAAFNNIVVDAPGLPTPAYQPASNLAPDTTYYWRVTGGNTCGSSTASAVWSFTTGIPRVLLVDDDNDAPDVLPTYQALLATMSINNEIWDTASGEPALGDLTNYEAIVWFSGDEFCGNTTPCAGPQTAAETALGQFLAAGGCVFVSAQDYLWDMGGSGHNTATPFMANYLGLASGTSDNGDYNAVVGKNAYVAIGNSPLTYPTGFSDFSDTLVAAAGGQLALDGTNDHDAAISKLGPNWFTTYLSFGLETLAAPQREAVFQKFLTWCEAARTLHADDFESNGLTFWDLVVIEP